MILIVFRGTECVLFPTVEGNSNVDKYNVFILHTHVHTHVFLYKISVYDCYNVN